MTEETRVEIKKAICTFCKGWCGVLVHVKDRRLVKAERDLQWPRKSYPPRCMRLRSAKEWFYHPERVNFPLKRAGGRGEGRWQRITWDQALDEVAQTLQQIMDDYGEQAIVATEGTAYRVEPSLRGHFYFTLGCLNIASQAQVCFLPAGRMADSIVGWFPRYTGLKPKITKCVVLLGLEPLPAWPSTARAFLDAKAEGARVIVIDPRRTRSASMADIWLQLRPGTDCALLMGMVNTIIIEELYDKEFVQNWCYGFDKLRKRAREYPAEVVEEVTAVPADKIREAARLYALNRPGCILEGEGVEHSQNNAQALHARWILAGLTGNIDVEGGEELSGPYTLNFFVQVMLYLEWKFPPIYWDSNWAQIDLDSLLRLATN